MTDLSPPSDPHISVLKQEVVDALTTNSGPTDRIFVDGTFGAGGYSAALLERRIGHLYGIDRDPDARKTAETLRAAHPDRFTFIAGTFGSMATLLAEHGVGPAAVDGIALDIGVSSMQIDQADRGFSFRFNGPLDMRMSQSGVDAAELVNTLAEEDLANMLYRLGEERQSRRIARAIVARRQDRPFETTADLADVIRGQLRRAKDGIDPATRSFQALRLAVNDELGELERGLADAETLLRPGGRLAVVSFHSLEDRIVKSFLKERSAQRGSGVSRHQPVMDAPHQSRSNIKAPTFRPVTKRPITPGAEEIRLNPRARSARLRVAERLASDPGGTAQ